MSLLFPAGERPDRAAIMEFAQRSDSSFCVALALDERGALKRRPLAAGLELLANGLQFDLFGLAPGPPAELSFPPQGHGIELQFSPSSMESLTCRPGPHLSGGGQMQPVLRALVAVAADLAELPDCAAVSWHSARNQCAAPHFAAQLRQWLDGGGFPAPCFATLVSVPDGGLQSIGLELFTGQELRLEPELVQGNPAATGLAWQLIHELIERGAVSERFSYTGLGGESLVLAPSANARFVRVSASA